jgi:hypothetical protein
MLQTWSYVMSILDGRPSTRALAAEITLRQLVRDLERASDGSHPTERIIARSPVLDNWQMPPVRSRASSVPSPAIRPSRTVTGTGPLWLFTPAHGYGRTLSGSYALGRPAPKANDFQSDS